MPEPVPVRVPLQIRWRDLDAQGHVNNAVYITYFEQARVGYVGAIAGDMPLVDSRLQGSHTHRSASGSVGRGPLSLEKCEMVLG